MMWPALLSLRRPPSVQRISNHSRLSTWQSVLLSMYDFSLATVEDSDWHCYVDSSLCSDGIGGANQCRSGESSGSGAHISYHFCQLIINQATLDNLVSSLFFKVKSVYEFLLEGDTLANLAAMEDPLARVSRVINNCTLFIENYSKTKNFCVSFWLPPWWYPDLV